MWGVPRRRVARNNDSQVRGGGCVAGPIRSQKLSERSQCAVHKEQVSFARSGHLTRSALASVISSCPPHLCGVFRHFIVRVIIARHFHVVCFVLLAATSVWCVPPLHCARDYCPPLPCGVFRHLNVRVNFAATSVWCVPPLHCARDSCRHLRVVCSATSMCA